MKKHLSTILLVLILVAGVAIMLYPTASDYWNSFHQSRAIASYAESVSHLTAANYERMWLDASAYNQTLLGKANPFAVSEDDWDEYAALLNVAGDGIMGYIEIPKISCSLPIYHGTDEAVLQIAVGHIQGSSLPVGGASTHCVLSGHRGLPSAKLFTDLDQLDEGDTFMLRVLNETLTYQVDQIRRVLPHELDDLAIAGGRDHCTLVTCTPYGVNTHRLLVRGKRIENTEEAAAVNITADALRIDPILVAPVAAAPMFIIVLVFLLSAPGRKRKKTKPKEKGATPPSPVPEPVPAPASTSSGGDAAGERQENDEKTENTAAASGAGAAAGGDLPASDGAGLRSDPGSGQDVQPDPDV